MTGVQTCALPIYNNYAGKTVDIQKTIAADYERDICDTEAANRAYQTDRNR